MLRIEVKNNGVDKALKDLKRKFSKIGITKELKDRQAFVKNSVRQREVIKKAKHRQKIKDQAQND
jgi:small subunit ribosomal protein S21